MKALILTAALIATISFIDSADAREYVLTSKPSQKTYVASFYFMFGNYFPRSRNERVSSARSFRLLKTGHIKATILLVYHK